MARWRCLWGVVLLLGVGLAQEAPKGPPPVSEFTKGFEKRAGLFDLYWDGARHKLFAAVRGDQLMQDFLVATTLARGRLGWTVAGVILDQKVMAFRRVGPQLQLLERDVIHRAAAGTPAAGAVANSHADSVYLALPILAEEGGTMLVDLGSPLLGGALVRGTRIDPSRSSIESAKAFPANLSLRVGMEIPSSPDSSYRVEFLFNVLQLPALGSYQPRASDDRVGFFTQVVNDYSSDADDTSKVRLACRWKLEKVDPTAAVSDAKEPIVWWIEKTVPEQHRGAIRAGILEWNKAYEKAGIRNAIEVRQQTADDDFDPADLRYTTFRWGAADAGYAIGPSAIDPRTGQILGAEVVFDDSMIRWQRLDFEAQTDAAPGGSQRAALSPDLAGLLGLSGATAAAAPSPEHSAAVPSWRCECRLQSRATAANLQLASCFELARQGRDPGGRLPPELLQQLIKQLAMHEVGHCLGLRHNFIASTMLPLAKMHDKALVEQQGLVGSVMDYAPANIALPGQPQGYYYTPTIGPYDYRAIEYGYRHFGNDSERLAVAARISAPGCDYATDEDVGRAQDPRTATFDLGEPTDWVQHRVALLRDGLPKVIDRTVAAGGEWQRARDAFAILFSALPDTLYRASDYLGGWSLARDHRGDANGRDPVVPVSFAQQRTALQVLLKTLFSEEFAAVDPALLRKLGPSVHSDAYTVKAHLDPERVVYACRAALLGDLLGSAKIQAFQDQAAYALAGEQPLTPAEVCDLLTSAVFPELPLPTAQAGAKAPSRLARNTQRNYIGRLAGLLGGDFPAMADARTLARMHLKAIRKALDSEARPTGEALLAAHYEELAAAIDRALAAGGMVRTW
ncbi:MAG: zinc-dependent metalloprotease [Fimbriimonadaceae bacterium]|nr:zinc-dependent metalloprotease [Fimbriimonadaceae bacterium]